MVIDDKGGEVIHKDRGREDKGKDDKGGENYESKGIKLKFEHRSRGRQLINLIDAFVCALHMFACMAQVLNSISMLVWCMLDHRK